MNEQEMFSWLQSCDGVHIRRCIQSRGTNTCTYYTNMYCTLTYWVVSSLKTATSRNTQHPDKAKYIIV